MEMHHETNYLTSLKRFINIADKILITYYKDSFIIKGS